MSYDLTAEYDAFRDTQLKSSSGSKAGYTKSELVTDF